MQVSHFCSEIVPPVGGMSIVFNFMTSYKSMVNFSSFQGFLDSKNIVLNNPLDKFVAAK